MCTCDDAHPPGEFALGIHSYSALSFKYSLFLEVGPDGCDKIRHCGEVVSSMQQHRESHSQAFAATTTVWMQFARLTPAFVGRHIRLAHAKFQLWSRGKIQPRIQSESFTAQPIPLTSSSTARRRHQLRRGIPHTPLCRAPWKMQVRRPLYLYHVLAACIRHHP